MDQKPSKKGDKSGGRPEPIEIAAVNDSITVQIACAMLSNPMIYPATTDSGIVKKAIQIRRELADEKLVL